MFHLFTVASDESKMSLLKQTADYYGIKIRVLSIIHWTGFIDKILAMKDAVDLLPDDDIACFIDAYDVLVIGDIPEILQKFENYRRGILMSSELNCYPPENQSRYDQIEYSVFEQEDANNIWGTRRSQAITTNYKYMNSGGYMGYVSDLKRMFQWKTTDEMRQMCELGGDQNFFTQYYLEFATDPVLNIGLDYRQEIFQSLYKVDLRNFAFFEGRLYNHTLRTYPCFVHFNGFRDYGGCLVHRKTGERHNAMAVFIEESCNSLEYGNTSMDWRLPDFFYRGVKQACISQKNL
jgi:hypothetical protein